jgi:hypothetical protein
LTNYSNPEEKHKARHVKGVKPLFLPGAGLKRNLEGITFEARPDAPGTLTIELFLRETPLWRVDKTQRFCL